MTSRAEQDRRLNRTIARATVRSFAEQYRPSKDDLRRQLHEAVVNTARLPVSNKQNAGAAR
jgi:hypothetical protein